MSSLFRTKRLLGPSKIARRLTDRREQKSDGEAHEGRKEHAPARRDQSRTAEHGTVTLTDSAVRGSFWLSAQWLVNKVVTAAATLVIVQFLSPEVYGVAMTALAVGAYVRIAPPEVLGQVLIAHTRHIELFSASARSA